MITNEQFGTSVHEVSDGIYRISTPLNIPGGGFSFNQRLIVDDEPLISHTGLRKMFPLVREAVASVRPARALADGESISLGKHSVRWLDTPHLPHAWECGFVMEEKMRKRSRRNAPTRSIGGPSR